MASRASRILIARLALATAIGGLVLGFTLEGGRALLALIAGGVGAMALLRLGWPSRSGRNRRKGDAGDATLAAFWAGGDGGDFGGGDGGGDF